MPITKQQFDRYNLLTALLCHKHTKSEILDKYHSAGFEVHKKTLNNDLSYLKDLGAKIHIPNRGNNRYYFEEAFSQEGSQFNEEDISILQQSIQLLSNTNGFHIANDLREVLIKSKYTKYYFTENAKPVVSFENHTVAEGTRHLDDLYTAIINKNCLKIAYSPNSTNIETEYEISPYFLKEYRNRWYLIGLKNADKFLMNMALDRIKGIKLNDSAQYISTTLDFEKIYENVIGITIPMNAEAVQIKLKVNRSSANYILSKPFLKNQVLETTNPDGSILIHFKAYINYELKQNILSYGSAIEVLEPIHLRQELFKIYSEAMNQNQAVNL
jgi:predicted DNA-binding transcriptional regulator YafY